MRLVERKINDVEISITLIPETPYEEERLEKIREYERELGLEPGELLEKQIEVSVEAWKNDPNNSVSYDTFLKQIVNVSLKRLEQMKKLK